MSRLFSVYPLTKLNGFDGGPDSIVADANHFNDPEEVAESIFVLYGYRVDPDKIKKIYLKYQLCGSNIEYAGYYASDSGVRGAFQVWSFDLDKLEVME